MCGKYFGLLDFYKSGNVRRKFTSSDYLLGHKELIQRTCINYFLMGRSFSSLLGWKSHSTCLRFLTIVDFFSLKAYSLEITA